MNEAVVEAARTRFSSSYAEARDKFRDQAKEVRAYRSPAGGLRGEELSTDVVQVGSVVHVKDEKTGKSVKYTIVGSAEAKPQEHKLSNESPVGRALLGRKRNETVAVKVPRGPARKLKITKIDVGLK